MAHLDVVDLTLALCEIPSLTGDEAAVADALAARLRAIGLQVTTQQVGEARGRANILATVDNRPPQILLTTHIDTVPPFIAPRLVDGVLLGRGVIDAKGIVAAMVCALSDLVARGEERVALLFVVGEETNSDGAKAAAQGFAPHVRYLIDGEPTDGLLCRATKGVLAFELEATGVPAHSAYPQAGHSAIHQLLDDLDRLRNAQWPDVPGIGATTLNVGTLAGGTAPNVLAPHALARLVMRTTSDADVLEARIRALLSPSTQMRTKTKSSPQQLVTVPGHETCVVAFGSDVPHLCGLASGGPLMLGPGSILDAHTEHERVPVAELKGAVGQYRDLALAGSAAHHP